MLLIVLAFQSGSLNPARVAAYAARPVSSFAHAAVPDGRPLPHLGGPDLRRLASLSGLGVPVDDALTLAREFERIGYRLSDIRAAREDVPRLFLTSLPADLRDVEPVADRKAIFISAMLPLVLNANREILEDRERIRRLREDLGAGHRLSPTDAAWLAGLTRSYGLDEGDFAGLLHRHDAVPVGLALAQGIEESGWGTSRFALEGNAVFGQWTFDEGQGIVPRDRKEGATHEVRAFATLADSVDHYIHNLNDHRAYREFRNLRARMRASGEPLDSLDLAKTMRRYSERGDAYVRTIVRLIRSNRLHELDTANLRDLRTVTVGG